MNNTESSRFRAYAVAIEHLKNNTAITDTVPAIKEVVEEAAALVENIQEADNKRLIIPKTGTAGKYQYTSELAEKPSSFRRPSSPMPPGQITRN